MRTTILSILLVTPAGCGTTATGHAGPDETGCSDVDGDGRGAGPDCAGPDCDDSDESIWDADACAARCDAGAIATGCPCDEVEPVTCYGGPEGTSGIGACVPGLRVCEDGAWSACTGDVVPTDEVCNSEDDDCDGESDEAPCDPSANCDASCAGVGDACRAWGDERAGEIVEDADGALTLDGAASARHVIWPSSGALGQVFRIATDTSEVEAVFWSGPARGTGGQDGLGTGESPSRTAVTSAGDAVIANRTPAGWNSVTKFAADSSTCPDVDGDGVVTTSSGIGDVLPFDAADDWQDECILWHTIVGDAPSSWARALSVARTFGLDGAVEERVWVGLWAEQKFQEIDVDTGELTGVEAPTTGYQPYSSAIDREGILWFGGSPVAAGGGVGRFDTADPEDSFEILPTDHEAKRVIVDENDVPWFAGQRTLWRLDRETDDLVHVDLFASPIDRASEQFGILASDGAGSVWVAVWNQEKVYRISNEEAPEIHAIATPGTPGFGLDADFDGNVWVFGWSRGNATKIDVDDESVETVFEDCGGPCGDYMYMRGDLTGLELRNSQGQMGSWGTVFEGCEDVGTDWTSLAVDRLVPEGAELHLSVRTADALPDLATAPWLALPDPAADGTIDLATALDEAGIESSSLLEVRTTLRSGAAGPPMLRSVEASHCCEVIIE